MVDNVKYPSLSEDGWVDSPVKIADYLLSCFFTSDYSQSHVFSGHVSSLPWILTDNHGDIGKTTIATQQTLSVYFSRYFQNVVVEVTEVPNEQEPSKAQMSIYVKFTDAAGTEYVVGKILKIAGTIIEKIIAINNG